MSFLHSFKLLLLIFLQKWSLQIKFWQQAKMAVDPQTSATVAGCNRVCCRSCLISTGHVNNVISCGACTVVQCWTCVLFGHNSFQHKVCYYEAMNTPIHPYLKACHLLFLPIRVTAVNTVPHSMSASPGQSPDLLPHQGPAVSDPTQSSCGPDLPPPQLSSTRHVTTMRPHRSVRDHKKSTRPVVPSPASLVKHVMTEREKREKCMSDTDEEKCLHRRGQKGIRTMFPLDSVPIPACFSVSHQLRAD